MKHIIMIALLSLTACATPPPVFKLKFPPRKSKNLNSGKQIA